MKRLLAIVLLPLVWGLAPAHAERADAGKDTLVQADGAHIDDATRIATLTGNVVVTKGTLKLTADKAILRETAQGSQHVTLIARPGGQATFRQKRDGPGDQWAEGEAQRVEYDERTGVVDLLGKAQVRQLEGGRVAKQMQNAMLRYDARRELMSTGGPEGQGRDGSRVTLRLSPKRGRTPAETEQ